jgi:hypothetical protein
VRYLCFLFLASVCAASEFDPVTARGYLAEADALCRKDNSKLWGVSLCGPFLIVDPVTRRFVSNPAIDVATLPETVGIANTAIDWNGRKWTMVMWPLPSSTVARQALLMHEAWHRVQAEIGLPPAGPANSHLAELEGRYWVQLEWRALRAALNTSDPAAKKAAVADALWFREQRRSKYPAAAAEERQLEMHEGLAGYTGCALSDDPVVCAIAELDRGPKQPSLVRSFAYASGPAYGALLDQVKPGWRTGLKPEQDFAALLVIAPAQADLSRYGAAELRAAEETRDKAHQKQLAEYRILYKDGPRLMLPLTNPALSFDPNTQTPLAGAGNVYGTIEVTDEWGTLKGTALVSDDWKKLMVPAPTDPAQRSGSGWKLELNPGWKLVAGGQDGVWKAVRE